MSLPLEVAKIWRQQRGHAQYCLHLFVSRFCRHLHCPFVYFLGHQRHVLTANPWANLAALDRFSIRQCFHGYRASGKAFCYFIGCYSPHCAQTMFSCVNASIPKALRTLISITC